MNFDSFDYPEYDSTMRLIFQKQEEIAKDIANQVDNAVYKAVHKIGVDIDKDKLVQALTQDKERYVEAYRNGYKAREADIIHCRDCKYFVIKEHWAEITGGIKILCADNCPTCTKWANGCMTKPDGYCFLAEKEEEDGDT